MAANQTAPTKVTVKAFIDALPDETKRADARATCRLSVFLPAGPLTFSMA